jgi:hypothetical protein
MLIFWKTGRTVGRILFCLGIQEFIHNGSVPVNVIILAPETGPLNKISTFTKTAACKERERVKTVERKCTFGGMVCSLQRRGKVEAAPRIDMTPYIESRRRSTFRDTHVHFRVTLYSENSLFNVGR